MEEIKLQPRSCEVCGGVNLEYVWSSVATVARTSGVLRFPYSVSVCRNCGFCFNSPCPANSDLVSYYADGPPGFKGIGLPYSIDARLTVLQQYSVPNGVYAEIGGDQPDEFHRRCAPLFGTLLNLDINDSLGEEKKTIIDLAENSLDVLAHYDVLEHVADVKDFLSACYRALKPGGFMICEVPDIRLYPRNLLLQEYEHVNHFSTTTLSAITSQVGLNPVEFSHICSRPYGFLAVFQKGNINIPKSFFKDEFIDALACVHGGIMQIKRCDEHIELVRQQIRLLGEKKITIWGVTDLLRSLLADFELSESILVVDSDPERKFHLKDLGVTVLQPKDVTEHIKYSELLVICAPRYCLEIVNWVAQKTAKTFSGSELQVIGSGPSGETLR